ncbi:MAG: tetratricopeptide repeat protein [Rhodobacteraceae bacterium]|nr:tetratricopeptide repeat protein [Paracoccaceae bacterium]
MSESVQSMKATASAVAEQVPSVLKAVRQRMRTLIAVQLVVAVGALGAAAWGFYSLQQYEKRKAELQQEIDAADSRLKGATDNLTAAQAELEEKAAEVGELEQRREDLAQEIDQQRQSLLFIENAVALIESEEYPAAVDALTKARDASPDSTTVLRLLSQAYAKTGEFGDAVETRQAAIEANREQNPDKVYASKSNPFALVDTADDIAWLAIYQCDAGDYSAAQRTFRDASGFVLEDLRKGERDLVEKIQEACADSPKPVAPQLALDHGASAPPPLNQTEERARERAEAYQIREIYMHVAAKADLAGAQALRQELEAAGYKVAGIDVIGGKKGYQRSVRYYYDEQKAQVAELSGLICGALGGGLASCEEAPMAEVPLVGLYKNLPRDRVEVWL